MRLLFVHQNFPAQYRHLAAHFGSSKDNQVVAIAKRGDANIPGVRVLTYQPRREPHNDIHHYIREFEGHILHGQGAVRAMTQLKNSGFYPDIVCAHPGWGETLFVKDVFPNAVMLNYCEFFYRANGSDVGFDPKSPPSLDTICRIRARNSTLILSLEACDRGIVPTRWQWQQHPKEFLDKISIIHDGIRTDIASPDPGATFTTDSGRTFTRADEVVTYAARNLEPYRGFPSFMRAAGLILKRRPNAHIIVVGGDDVSYGAKAPDGKTYRQMMLDEVDLDLSRIHFHGRLPYDRFLSVLKVSQAHIYLTYPFVLSWSMLESMSCGCLVVGSRTQPVEEVIRDGENGLLVDFYSPESIAEAIDRVFDHPDRMESLRQRARETILAGYDLKDCLQKQIALIHDLVARRVIPNRNPAVLAPATSAPAAGPADKKRQVGKSRLPANLRRR